MLATVRCTLGLGYSITLDLVCCAHMVGLYSPTFEHGSEASASPTFVS